MATLKPRAVRNTMRQERIAPRSLISVIICTYGRATALEQLLQCLERQTYQNFEVLLIDGNGESSPARGTADKFPNRPGSPMKLVLIDSERGLTRQRNVGLQAARGDLICFLDDDVTFEKDFLAGVASRFERFDFEDVGGITPYDVLHYPIPITQRWRLRSSLGVMPGLDPGRVDHLGRAVPLSFLKPLSEDKEVGWLPGFCMIYRRTAVAGLRFDELLPTYGGEDRDFSMRVGRNCRLMICGELHVKHNYTTEGRDDGLDRLRQSSFGVGRRFGKYAKGFRDYVTVAQTFLGDLAIDALAFVRQPGRANLSALFVRAQAFCAGLRSGREPERQTEAIQAKKSLGQPGPCRTQ